MPLAPFRPLPNLPAFLRKKSEIGHRTVVVGVMRQLASSESTLKAGKPARPYDPERAWSDLQRADI
jgi:hypothetical protein